MSEEKLVSTNIQVIKEDAVQVLVSKYEIHHLNLEKKLNAEIKVLNAEKGTLLKEIDTILKETPKKVFGTSVDKTFKNIKKTVKEFDPETSISLCFTSSERNKRGNDRELALYCNITINGNNSISKNITIPYPKEIIAIEKEREKIIKAIGKKEEELVEVMVALRALSTGERRAKALLAERSLANNPEGKKLLDLLGNLDNLKALPMSR